MTKKLHGRGGPGRNQGRKPNTAKGLAEGRTLAITIKVSPEVKALLQRRADEAGETLSAYCAEVLDWHHTAPPFWTGIILRRRSGLARGDESEVDGKGKTRYETEELYRY